MARRGPRRRAELLGWGLHAGVLVGAAAAVRIDRRARRRLDVGAPVGSAVVIGAFWATLAVLERRHPFRAEWARPVPRDPDPSTSTSTGTGTGTGTGTDLTTDLASFVAILPANFGAAAVGTALAKRLPRRIDLSGLPTPVAVALTIAAYDLGHCLMHRLGHEWGPAWRVHSVHHSPERLYWFNATRFHTIETMVDGLIEGMVSGSVGLSADQDVAYRTVRALYGQLQHANIELRSGALDRVFSTPDLHRWHHSTDYDEGDTNYGAITSIWDQLLGTYFRPDRPFDAVVGVGRMPNFPSTFAGLEAAPFRWQAIRRANAATLAPAPDR